MRAIDMKKIGSLLDDVVAKGDSLERPVGMVERFEKALSFDPFQPHQMTEQSVYHNPYSQLADGTFAPMPPEYWETRGRDTSGYDTVRQFYRDAGVDRERAQERESTQLQESIARRFRNMAKSLDAKKPAAPAPAAKTASPTQTPKGGVPIGTVHTYTDGQRYKKVEDGKWVPMSGLEKKSVPDMLKHPEHGQKAQAGMESHASQSLQIQDAMKKRQGEKEIVETAKHEARKEVMDQVKTLMTKLYDGKMPGDVAKIFKEAADGNANKGPAKLDAGGPIGEGIELADMAQETPTGHKKHSVDVNFTYNGQKYNRQFNVVAKTPNDAQGRVQEALIKKLGRGVQIGKVKATAEKAPKPEAMAAKK